MARILLFPLFAVGLIALGFGQAEEAKGGKNDPKKAEKKLPVPAIPPTAANVPYGPLERQVLDFWQAKSDKPTPVVICIHGGGFRAGKREGHDALAKAGE